MNDPEMFQQKQGSLKTKLRTSQERRKKEFEEEYTQRIYMLHSQMAREMTEDYKQQAINQALLEFFCKGEKYTNKYSGLKESYQSMEQQWVRIKREYKDYVESMLQEIKRLEVPQSI